MASHHRSLSTSHINNIQQWHHTIAAGITPHPFCGIKPPWYTLPTASHRRCRHQTESHRRRLVTASYRRRSHPAALHRRRLVTSPRGSITPMSSPSGIAPPMTSASRRHPPPHMESVVSFNGIVPSSPCRRSITLRPPLDADEASTTPCATTSWQRHRAATSLLVLPASISHGVRPAAATALDLRALIPNVGGCISQPHLLPLILSISLVSLT
jgi:hypothetical protein